MCCRVCLGERLSAIGRVYDAEWFRCADCGSDTSDQQWWADLYNAEFASQEIRKSGREQAIKQVTANVNLIGQLHTPDKTFLDIGCNEGAAIDAMIRRGWDCWGYEINPAVAEVNPHVATGRVVIADHFRHSLFERQFSVVMLRDVIEHVEDWRMLLSESWKCLLPGGYVQVQTPLPALPENVDQSQMVYAPGHLMVFSTAALQMVLIASGFVITHVKAWHGINCGQCITGMKHGDST